MKWFCPLCRKHADPKLEYCPEHGVALVEDVSGSVLAGNYQLERLIGIGGMGSTVWRANQAKINRPVAVKLLPPATEILGKRFAREARIASHLNHPNIVIIHDYGQSDDNKLYLVMEFLEGNTLQREIKRLGSLPVDRALHIANQVLLGLEHAHGKLVVHRDLKPGNLFLTNRNNDPDYVKILDFGLAKSFADENETHIAGQSLEELNVTGTEKVLCGTPNFMAVEQLFCTELDARTDVYAMGVVLFLMVSGQLPFVASTSNELYQKIISQPVPSLDDVLPTHQVSPAVEQVIRKALSKEAASRYCDAAAMRAALNEAASEAVQIRLQPQRSPHWSKESTEPNPNDTVYSKPPSTSDSGIVASTKARVGRGAVLTLLVVAILVVLGIGYVNRQSHEGRATISRSTASQSTSKAVKRPTTNPLPPSQNDLSPGVEVAAGTSISVTLTSVPADATVNYLNKEVGKTPFTILLEKEVHKITLKKDGFTPFTVSLDLQHLSRDSFEQEVVLKALVPGVAQPKRVSPPKKRTKGASVKLLDPRIKTKRFPLQGVESKAGQARKTRKVRIQLLDEDAPREMSNQATKKSNSSPRKIKIETLGD